MVSLHDDDAAVASPAPLPRCPWIRKPLPFAFTVSSTSITGFPAPDLLGKQSAVPASITLQRHTAHSWCGSWKVGRLCITWSLAWFIGGDNHEREPGWLVTSGQDDPLGAKHPSNAVHFDMQHLNCQPGRRSLSGRHSWVRIWDPLGNCCRDSLS